MLAMHEVNPAPSLGKSGTLETASAERGLASLRHRDRHASSQQFTSSQRDTTLRHFYHSLKQKQAY